MQQALSKQEAEQMATKGDVALVRKDVDLLRKDVNVDVALLRKDMDAMENRLVVKLSAVMVAVVGLAGVVMTWVNKAV